jgi:hypothetical protein
MIDLIKRFIGLENTGAYFLKQLQQMRVVKIVTGRRCV